MKNRIIEIRYQVLNFDSFSNVSKYPIEQGVNNTKSALFFSSLFDKTAINLKVNKVIVPPIRDIQKELINI